jgi:hypothetical protein
MRMRQFAFSGYTIEVEEGRLSWRAVWWRAFVVVVVKLMVIAIAAPWAYALVGVALSGQWDKPLDQANVFLWIVTVGFELLLLACGLVFGLFALGTAYELAAFLVLGMRTFTFDRWDGQLRLGRRTLCELEQVESVCVDVRDDSEGGLQWLIALRLKGGQMRDIPHFYVANPGPEDVTRFVNEIAAFLDVPVIKAKAEASNRQAVAMEW